MSCDESQWTALGCLRLVALTPPLFTVFDVKSGCPSTTFASVPLIVGTVFQIRTRLFEVSATTMWLPSVHASRGALTLWALKPPLLDAFDVKLGCPRTTPAPFWVTAGIVFQSS